MKNWKKIMAGLCAAAMVSSMVVPVWAAEETTEEAADDGDVADVSEAMLGLWMTAQEISTDSTKIIRFLVSGRMKSRMFLVYMP